jgi:hypothetical protein
MSDNHPSVHESVRRHLAAVSSIAPIVDCIRKMRVEGLADNEIAGLFRHAADELEDATSGHQLSALGCPLSARSRLASESPGLP